ncbi:MAG: right-handed parallel beta-helix repeat-containing protein [Thermoplasmatales archaeon]|nr:right-handed parallel beta-helix repeat-containing protein [Thermoplasmatales archaeon]
MKKILTIGIMLLFIGMTISSSTGLNLEKQLIQPMSFDNTLYVGGNGTGNYSKIQDAINDSSNGDTVYVYDDSSPYYENLNVDKSITLIGEDKDTTVIDGTSVENIVVNISADNVILSGFTIQKFGIYNYSYDHYLINILSDYNIISDNIFTSNRTVGVHILYSEYNNISDNIFTFDISWGIEISVSNHTTISNNIISVRGSGIFLEVANNNNIIGNLVTDGNYGIELSFSQNNYVFGNTALNNSYGGISSMFSDNNTIILNNLSNNEKWGIIVQDSFNEKVLQNNLLGNNESNGYFFHTIFMAIFARITFGLKPIIPNIIPRIHWDGNYWGEPRTKPYIISGYLGFSLLMPNIFHRLLGRTPNNWFYLDRNPAQEPYDIEM